MSHPSFHPILTQHFDTNEVAFAKIDKEISTYQENIRVLNAFRNTFTPIYRLPPEVLTRIFSFTREFPKPHIYHGTAPFTPWLIVTRVSQHWRNVSFGSPGLWSYISSAFHKRVGQECLRLSKEAPLAIDLRYIAAHEVDQLVNPSLFRIRELKLGLTSNAWNGFSPNLVSTPAPLLEHLSIFITDTSSPVMIPDMIFAGSTPRLRHLVLSGCSFDISSPLLTDLTVLELRKPPQKISTVDILTTLQTLPCLTSLVLANVLQTGVPPVSSDLDIVSLSALESLSIVGQSFVQDLDTLSHLSFPATTTLQLHSDAGTREGQAITALSDFLSVHKTARLQDLSTVSPTNIELQCSSATLRLFISSQRSEPTEVIKYLDFDLVGEWEHLLDLPDTPDTASLLSSLPMTSITSFLTNCDIGIGTWTNTIGSLPNLQRIEATGTESYNLLSAIVKDFKATCPAVFGNKSRSRAGTRGRRRKGKGSRGGGRSKAQTQPSSTSDAGSSLQSTETWDPIFPSLETIMLEETTFPARTTELVAALRARRMADKGIKTLGIAECRGVKESLIGRLQDSVDHVMWDGRTGSDEGDDDDDSGVEHEDNVSYLPLTYTWLGGFTPQMAALAWSANTTAG
ncbi:hypothetical protein BDN72DRAFT_847614 [Pluteus cervinus]|uniref:Uncharacterized protein n=1 Tax=Pluteus cervinus TaxID=181527 RepID=A0ACD3ACS2_9AGAR|nr:hypothetical protein BDN72DRAFT_847614 [Pluteus cervinus]